MVKISKRLLTILDSAEKFCAPAVRTDNYPDSIVDLLIFHRMHFHMTPTKARRCFNHLKSEFVDWNEVRVSVIRDIQIGLRNSYDSLELAVFIKNFLEFIHGELREISLEYLREENLSETKQFLKQIKGIKPATIEMVLMHVKERPVLPLTLEMEKLLVKLSLAKKTETRDRKGKRLYDLVGPEKVIPLHHYLLYHTNVYEKMPEPEELPADLSLGRSRTSPAKNSKTSAKKKTSK